MKTIFYLLSVWISMLGYGQEFRKGEVFLLHTSQVIPEQFTAISLPDLMRSSKGPYRFDPANPDTFIEVLYDKKQKPYQVLYQTNFLGKIVFLAYSNNLHPVFNRRDKPIYFFHHCLRLVNEAWSPLQISEQVMDCIISRLNQCAGP